MLGGVFVSKQDYAEAGRWITSRPVGACLDQGADQGYFGIFTDFLCKYNRS